MKVLILEDVIEHQVRLERRLGWNFKRIEYSNIIIKQQEKSESFKEYIENDEVNQLYFLDIDIHGIEKKDLKLLSLFVITILTLLSSLSPVDQSLRPWPINTKYQRLDFVDKDTNDELFKKRIEQNIFYTKVCYLKMKMLIIILTYNYKEMI